MQVVVQARSYELGGPEVTSATLCRVGGAVVLAVLATASCLDGSGVVSDDAGGDVGADLRDEDASGCGAAVQAWDPVTGCPSPAIDAPFLGPRAYVSVANSDVVAVLDLCDPAQARVVRCVDVDANAEWEDEPYDMAVASDGTWYVTVPHAAGFTSGELWKFAPGAVRGAQRVALTAEPDHVDVSPDGGRVYVTALRNLEAPFGPYTEPGELTILDAASLGTEMTLRVGLAAADVKVAPDGSAVVAAVAGTDEIFVFEPATEEARFLPVGPEPGRGQPRYQPFYLELDWPRRRAFVSCLRSGDLRVVDLDSGQLAGRVDLGTLTEPRDVALIPDRNLAVVADTAGNRLVVVDTVALAVSGTVSVGPPEVSVGAPFGVAPIAGTPYVLVANSRDPVVAAEPGVVAVVDLERMAVVHTVPVGLGPRLIAVAP